MKKYELNIKPKYIQDLIECYKSGMTLQASCDYAFIELSTVWRWKKQYEEFLQQRDNGENVDLKLLEIPVDKDDNLIYSKLNALTICKVLSHARSSFQRECIENAKIDDKYQRWQWFLERVFKNDFGNNPTESEVKKVESIKVVYVDPSKDKERLERLEQEVKDTLK